MSDISSDAPSVKIIPPLVYLAGLVIGFLANIWMPIKVVPSLVAWTSGRNFHFLRCRSDEFCRNQIQGCGHNSST